MKLRFTFFVVRQEKMKISPNLGIFLPSVCALCLHQVRSCRWESSLPSSCKQQRWPPLPATGRSGLCKLWTCHPIWPLVSKMYVTLLWPLVGRTVFKAFWKGSLSWVIILKLAQVKLSLSFLDQLLITWLINWRASVSFSNPSLSKAASLWFAWRHAISEDS